MAGMRGVQTRAILVYVLVRLEKGIEHTWTRADSVDSDTPVELLVAQGTGESHDGTLGGGVVEQVGTTNVVVDGRACDDGVAARHVRKGVLGEEEEGVNVCGEGVDPLVFGEVVDLLDHHLVAVVQDEDVDVAHQLQCLLDNVLAGLVASEIGGDAVQLASLLLHESDGLLSILLLLWQVDDRALCALHGVQDGYRTADTTVTSGDESLLAAKFSSSEVWLVATI